MCLLSEWKDTTEVVTRGPFQYTPPSIHSLYHPTQQTQLWYTVNPFTGRTLQSLDLYDSYVIMDLHMTTFLNPPRILVNGVKTGLKIWSALSNHMFLGGFISSNDINGMHKFVSGRIMNGSCKDVYATAFICSTMDFKFLLRDNYTPML